jgi:hypothetical protein
MEATKLYDRVPLLLYDAKRRGTTIRWPVACALLNVMENGPSYVFLSFRHAVACMFVTDYTISPTLLHVLTYLPSSYQDPLSAVLSALNLLMHFTVWLSFFLLAISLVFRDDWNRDRGCMNGATELVPFNLKPGFLVVLVPSILVGCG